MDKILQRIERHIERIPMSSCWIWNGYTNKDGYGKMALKGKAVSVHRVVYEYKFGAIDKSLEIDHLCRVRSCCNPLHLQAIPHIENVRRGDLGKWNKEKTSCPKGHPYEGDNLYIPPYRGYQQRQCRQCRLEAKRRFRQRKKNAC